jgi:hypothetical protein
MRVGASRLVEGNAVRDPVEVRAHGVSSKGAVAPKLKKLLRACFLVPLVISVKDLTAPPPQ